MASQETSTTPNLTYHRSGWSYEKNVQNITDAFYSFGSVHALHEVNSYRDQPPHPANVGFCPLNIFIIVTAICYTHMSSLPCETIECGNL